MKEQFPKHQKTVLFIMAAAMAVVIFNVPDTPENFFASNKLNAHIKPSQPLTIPTFSDQAIESGIFFTHVQGGEKLAGLDESLGAGACAFDYDNDGWIDLFLIGGSGQTHHFGHKQWWQKKRGNRLFRNTGNAKFEDVTAQAGLENTDSIGMGCAHADLDNDGDQELLITTLGNNILYQNSGDGTFQDITAESGIHGDAWSTSVAIADYNGDGFLDIYIANYIKFDKRARTLETDAGYIPHPPPLFDASLFDAQPNQLFLNMGGLKFDELAKNAGVDDQGGRGLSALWLDANDDGLPDLVVGNDKETPSRLFINDGDGTFTPAGDQFGINNNSGFQSMASSDIDGDGKIDIMAGTPSGQLLKILLHQRAQQHTFSDAARGLGLSNAQYAVYSTWGIGVHDFNLDGSLDLMAFNGLRHPDSDASRISVGQQKNLWLNSNGGFIDTTLKSGVSLTDNISARGAAFADFDNDGDIDVLTIHNNNPAQLLINQISHQNWLGIQLQATSGNRDAIGAKVKLTTASGSRYRDVSSSSGFLSDHDRRLQFGLNHDEQIIGLFVTWSDGSESSYKNISPNRYYLLQQGESKAIALLTKPVTIASARQPQLTFGKKNSEFRITYLQWLIASGKHVMAIETIEHFVSDPIPSVRMQAMKLLQNIPLNMKALRILSVGVNDPYAEVRVATIQALKQYEDESTIYWLLRALHDKDETVRIASAETFEHFFREEEAMINKKQLAIPHLISLLKDQSPKVRAAAARALGETESYRGIEPLIQLTTDKDHHVKIEAIRSLGLLREIRALSALESIASSPKHSSLVRAHAFIALKRLGSVEANQFIEAEFTIKNSLISSATASLFTSLLTIEGGRVFEQTVFLKQILTWLQRQNINPDNSGIENLLIVINALKNISGKSIYDAVQPFSNSKHGDIRKRTYQTLFSSPDHPSSALLNKALSDSLPEIQNLALETVQNHHLKLSSKKLLRLLANSITSEAANQLLAEQLTPGIENKLITLAVSQKNSPELRLAVLSALSKHQTTSATNALKTIAFNTNEIFILRQQALRSFAQKYPGSSDLIRLTHLRHDPLSNDAFTLLATQHNKHAVNKLWNMLNNPNEKEADRIFAANILYPLNPQKTIAILQGNPQ